MSSRSASRDARLIAAATLFSRVTGLARVVVASAVMGTGALGGLYETTNRIPNFLFDLFAGGALQAVLVPAFVRARDEHGEAGLKDLADAVAGSLTVFLGLVTAAGMAASPLLIRALTAAEPDAAVRADKVRLGTVFMLVFIPQVLCYGVAVVASGALAARHRFVAAAAAPAVNNVVAIGAYGVYRVLHHGTTPTLHLTPREFAVLAGGTTFAVVAFAAVPVWLARRAHVLGRPRLDPEAAARTGLRRAGGWAVVQVAGGLVLTITAVVLGNGSDNGVGVFLWSQYFLLLPVALVAAPLGTAAEPRLVLARLRHDDVEGRRQSEGVLVLGTVGLAGASAVLVGLGWPIVRLVAFGETVRTGPAPLARTLVAFGGGLLAAGLVFLVTRLLFSIDDARGAALTTLVLAASGFVTMTVAAEVASRANRAPALAVGFGAAHVVAAAAMLARYERRSHWLHLRGCARPMAAAVVAAALVAAGFAAGADRFPHSRVGSLGALLVLGTAGLGAYLLLVRVLSGRSLRSMLHFDAV